MSEAASPPKRRGRVPDLIGWLFLAPLVLLILVGIGQLALLTMGRGQQPNLRSQLRADYRPWPTTVFGALSPALVDELLREQGFPGEATEFVIPGQLWLTATPGPAPAPTALTAVAQLPTPVITIIVPPTNTAAPTDTAQPAPTDTPTAAPSDTPTATPTLTRIFILTATATSSPTSSPIAPPAPTDTPAPGPTDTPTATPTITPSIVTVSGSVFEDVNYAGGPGGPRDPGDGLLPNVRVELYTGAAFVGFTLTDPSGVYTFTVASNGVYRVRVVAASLGDADTPPTAGLNFAATVVAEQTFESDGVTGNGGAGALGGDDPLADDAATAPGAGPGDDEVTVAPNGGSLAGVDFGFSYHLIVNTRDGGQGSLRQFLLNANAIAGADAAQFNLPTSDPNFNGLVAGAFAFQPASPLPALTDAATTLDGATQEANRGDQRPGLPDVVIDGQLAGANADGLNVQGGANLIGRLDLRNFNQGTGTGLLVAGDGNTVTGNYLTRNTNNLGLGALQVAATADNNQITGNLIDGNFGDGLEFAAGASTGNTASGNTLTNSADDGAVLAGTSLTFVNNTIQTNGVGSPLGCGIEVIGLTNSVIAGNTVQGNGQRGGICLIAGASTGNTIGPNNTLAVNEGPGVAIIAAGSVRNHITANAISGNQGLGIDLTGDGVTANDPGDGDTGANALMNYPELYTATLDGLGNVVITGEARPNSTVEFFLAAPDPTNYGEGQVYLGSTLAPALGTPGANDPSARQFSVTLPTGPVVAGSAITATATDGAGNTSEFALIVIVP